MSQELATLTDGRCTKCGHPLTNEDLDWGRKNQPDTLGFYVNCDTCNKPQRLCVYCWNDTDDCNECEDKAEAGKDQRS